jgi:hypothetical protein
VGLWEGEKRERMEGLQERERGKKYVEEAELGVTHWDVVAGR